MNISRSIVGSTIVLPGVRVRFGLDATGTQFLILLLTYLESLLRVAWSERLVRQLVLLGCFAPLPGRVQRPSTKHHGFAIDHSGSFVRWTQVRASWS